MIALAIACTCCIFYLQESFLLRHKCPLSPLLKLPSLEWSLSVFRISCVIAIGCLCLCALGGVLLNIHRDNVMSVWRDPIIVGTVCVLLILLFGSLKWLFRSPRTTENRFVFMLVMVVFLTFLFLLIIVLASSNAHWNRKSAPENTGESASVSAR
jgi:NADH:ubiquinone oxidoreductase subunit 6 (subunit J)